jgi:hypothetical protein
MYALPKVDSAAKTRFQRLMAMHHYVTGKPFQHIDDDNQHAAILVLRSDDCLLPTRKRLVGDLLEKCYIEIKGMCDAMINRVLWPFCLVSDGWSNIRNELVVNYMAASASCTL